MATIANLKVDQGADFATTINLNNLDGTDFNLSGYTVKSQMAKSYASTTKIDITAAITNAATGAIQLSLCLLYTSPSPRDLSTSRMPSSA